MSSLLQIFSPSLAHYSMRQAAPQSTCMAIEVGRRSPLRKADRAWTWRLALPLRSRAQVLVEMRAGRWTATRTGNFKSIR
jgi:hypothetical protein